MNKAIIIIIISLFAFTNLNAQVLSPNLVQNPSFEVFSSCPLGTDELYLATHWWGFSTEYYNACGLPGTFSVPLNVGGFQNAHTGVAYAACAIYENNNYRETIKTILSDSLIANKRYCTKFYISLAEYTYIWSPTAYVLLDSIGMLITKDSVQDNTLPIFNNGIKVQNDIFNIDTINWSKITNTFISNGGEQYLTIGNFDNFIINYPSNLSGRTYIYIDDVSVCECSFAFSLGNDTTLCEGETLVLNPNMPNAIYKWQDSSHVATYTVTKAGTYWVRAYFPDYGITTSDTIIINYLPLPIINLGSDYKLCQGDTITLNATINKGSYLWQDGSTSPISKITQLGYYWVKVTDTTTKCSSTDNINVTYSNCNPINIPNSFTPNGDGLNDEFKIVTLAEFSEFKMIIYNRWGELLFESTDKNKGWDGTFKGKFVPYGVYVYLVTGIIKDTNEQIKRNGTVTLLR